MSRNQMIKNPLQKKKKSGKTPEQKAPRPMNMLLTAVLILMSITALYSLVFDSAKTQSITISELAQKVTAGEVTGILVEGSKLEATLADGTVVKSKKEVEASLTETFTNYGVPAEKISSTKIDIKNESGFGYVLMNLLPILLPVMLVIYLIWALSRQVKGQGMQAFSFGQSKARITDPNDEKNKVTFKDVAGNKEAKQELAEIVDFLRNPKKFLDIGAQIPKGVLLTGAPGTGKTLLARAVAGEAQVPFFHLSGSEFVEMFVGVGASRVRDLFQMAKKASPAIVFVDEIDAVGRVRGTGIGGGNDEREQTLNQILVEMDGFDPTEKVIVMAATNRADVLDPALLRPGRFDRRVKLDLPDRADREEILVIHSKKKPFADDVDLKVIAARTPGFSGADLYSLMNEGAISAARQDRTTILQLDLIQSIEKVMLGPERKSHLMSPKEKEITAYHEAGHALVASVLPDADPVHKVSIVSRGSAGGYTLKLPVEERKLQTSQEFHDDIAVSLGGYVVEQMVFGDVTTGPSSDLQVATNLARAMVTRWGMSEAIGPIAFEQSGGKFGEEADELFRAPEIAKRVADEVRRIIDENKERAKKAIVDNRPLLDAIAKKLVEVETLEQEEFDKILVAHGLVPKKKEEIAKV